MLSRTLYLLLSFALAAPTPGLAEARLNDPELAGQRGGYISAGGLSFNFGATVTTAIDGALALRTTLNLTDQGAQTTQVAGTIGALEGSSLVAPGADGLTRVTQSLSASQILNLVVNTASGRVINQNTAIILTIPNLGALRQGAAAQQTVMNLQTAVGLGLVGASVH